MCFVTCTFHLLRATHLECAVVALVELDPLLEVVVCDIVRGGLPQLLDIVLDHTWVIADALDPQDLVAILPPPKSEATYQTHDVQRAMSELTAGTATDLFRHALHDEVPSVLGDVGPVQNRYLTRSNPGIKMSPVQTDRWLPVGPAPTHNRSQSSPCFSPHFLPRSSVATSGP